MTTLAPNPGRLADRAGRSRCSSVASGNAGYQRKRGTRS
jgi:hypothetical protein